MKKRIVCVVLMVCLIISAFSGCTKKSTVADNGEQVTLRWVIGGPGELEDSERVWEAFNEKLAEYLPNTKVEFKVISHADYAEKWRLMCAAKEDVDIAWVSYALKFSDEVSKGAYMDITDLIEEYGQDMKAEFPEWLLDLTTIDGRIYAIPNYQMMGAPMGFSVDKAHVEKGWFDIEKAEAIFQSGKSISKDDYKFFEEYFDKVKESGEKVKYVSNGFITNALKKIGEPVGGIESVICNAVIKKTDDSIKVYDKLTDFPESYDYYDLVYEWYQKGYIRPDILENPTEVAKDYLLPWTYTLKGCDERDTISLGREVTSFVMDPQAYIGYKGSATNTAVAAQSKNPARAVQLLNLMNSSKGAELMNLITYGFEGEHYKKISDNRIEWLGKDVVGSEANSYGYHNWAIGNALVTYETQSEPEGWNKYIHEDINMNAKKSPLAGFTFDPKPIKMEIANYNAVMKEYEYLEKGATANYKELLKERNEKLKQAGSEKIVAEVQRQIDEWVKQTR